jgi:hypothetical protein
VKRTERSEKQILSDDRKGEEKAALKSGLPSWKGEMKEKIMI